MLDSLAESEGGALWSRLSIASGSYSEYPRVYRGGVNFRQFGGVAPAYFQIEIRVTEAGQQPWQIRGSFGASMDDLRWIVNWKAGAEPFVSNPLSDDPWPVAAKHLLTERERSLYQCLLDLYPEHKLFIQVALSQLIDVPEGHPERMFIRNQFSQLVADFVLCRSNLSVIAVIELDDRSHERAHRRRADARKNKALADAGIRLVRIPAGRLPTEDDLRKLVNAEGAVEEGVQEEAVLSLVEPVDTYDEAPPHGWQDHPSAESRELKRVALKTIAVAVLLLGGWFIFSQLLPAVVKQALQPLAVPRVRAASAPPNSIPVAPVRIPATPVISGPSAEELAWQKRVQIQAANALQKKKDTAWAAFYSAPASCERPVDWNAQVECGNQYMRAKRRFEEQWGANQGTGAEVVLGNGSVGGSRK
jgi:hypothetical protein